MPTKKSPTKEGAMAAKPNGKSASKKSPTKSATASSTKAPAPRGKRAGKATNEAVYTKPELREKLKEQIKAGDKGGKSGQWSARKAQLLAAEYTKEGGGYEGGRAAPQKHLQSWTEEKWQTVDGKKAARGKTTARYLPKDAWEKLTPAQREADDKKKKTASRTGKQFIANTPAAKKARKAASHS